jgi:hypothetical protein
MMVYKPKLSQSLLKLSSYTGYAHVLNTVLSKSCNPTKDLLFSQFHCRS